MKTLDQVVGYESQCLDARDLSRLADFIPDERLAEFGLTATRYRVVKPWTREAILEQLQLDVAFGFKKALDRRGISSEAMFYVVKMWNWILEEGLTRWPNTRYAMYGLPLFKATAVKYGWPNPIGDDTGSEDKYTDPPVRPVCIGRHGGCREVRKGNCIQGHFLRTGYGKGIRFCLLYWVRLYKPTNGGLARRCTACVKEWP